MQVGRINFAPSENIADAIKRLAQPTPEQRITILESKVAELTRQIRSTQK